jgi:hypothetical protein
MQVHRQKDDLISLLLWLWVRFPIRPLEISNDLILPVASNRNAYQESSWGGGGKGGRAVRLTSRHLCADCLENVGASTAYNPMGLHALLQG